MIAPAPDDGVGEWCELSETLLRGLVHSLNNRLTALSAFTELAAMGDPEFAAGAVLPAELARMQQVSVLFRLLVGDGTAPEALELGPVLDDALALHAHHPVLRAVRCEVVRDGALPPVRTTRWALLRLLLVLVETGKQEAERFGRETMTLRVSGDEGCVTLRAEGARPTRYAEAMARRTGATLTGSAEGALLSLPSLQETRRMERDGRA